MRIQLKLIHLLLIGPTFLVVVIMLAANKLPYYYWSIASKEVNRLEARIQMLQETDSVDRKVSQEVVESWLDGTFGDHHRVLGECPEKDPWGNAYRCVTRSVDDKDRIVFFSLGRDGTSKSDGNDKDDLNSWNDDGLKWYRRSDNRREKMDLVVQGLVITSLIYVLFLLIKGAAVAEKKRKGL